MSVYLNEERRLGYWIEKQLLSNTEWLCLTGNGVNNVVLAKVENIRWLELRKCSSMKEIETKWLASLEHLRLFNLPKLEKIWDDGNVLPHLKVLKIERCKMMEQVFWRNGDSRHSNDIAKVFLKLEGVYLEDLPNVISFYQGIEVIEFPQLRKLEIRRCGKMKSMVSKWMGSNENNPGGGGSNEDSHKPEGLKEFTICGYEGCASLITSSITKELANVNLKQYDEMDEDKGMSGDQRTLLFPKLEELYLDDLTEFESFCEWKWEDELPSLREVKIGNCPNMKQLWKTSSLRQNDQTKDCLQQLQYMKWLELRKCETPNEIETKWFSPIELRLFKLRKLEEVYLEDLPNMTSFYEGIEGIEFPQLRKLEIRRCGKMKSMVSKWMGSNENNSEGSSSNKDTYKPQEGLEAFTICGYEDCTSFITSSITTKLTNMNPKQYDEMIKGDEEKGMSADQRTLLFPKLQELYLGDLSELVSLCESKCEDELPSLRIVEIWNCRNMKQLWKTSSLRQNDRTKDFLPQLQVLSIRDCDMMEQIFLWDGEDGNKIYTSETLNSHRIKKVIPKIEKIKLDNLPNLTSFYQGIEAIEFPELREMEIVKCRKMKTMVSKGMECNENNWGDPTRNRDIHHHLSCQPQEVSFGCLNNLSMDWNPFGGVSLFGGLERLTIKGCEGGTSWITTSIATTLVYLTHLNIEECDEMVQVIKNDEVQGSQTTLLLPELQKLYFLNSPKLVSFCECDVELPSLSELKIIECPNMKNLTLGSLAAPNLESFAADFVNHLHFQAPFNGVKKLAIRENKHPLNYYEFNESQFNGLEVLKIVGYKGSVGLFSASITRTLINLTKLTISDCDKMVKVIEDEEEKEKVVSGSGQSTIRIFPKLEKLELIGLCELESFCEWKCDVELPSLREVEITDITSMKYFTLGRLVTPNLESVEIYYEDYDVAEDLNGVVLREISKKDEECEEEEDDGV